MKKKLFVLLMSFLLVFMALPFSETASAGVAVGHDHTGGILYTTPLSSDCITTLYGEDVLAEDNYYLKTDTEITTDIYIEEGTTVNLCLNGHKLTCLNFEVHGTLNVCDCSSGKTGQIVFAACDTPMVLSGFCVYGGKLDINGGSYEVLGLYDNVVYTGNGTEVNIKNANFKSVAFYDFMLSGDSTFNCESSTLTCVGQGTDTSGVITLSFDGNTTPLVATFKDCTFNASSGRAVYCEHGQWTFDNCDFKDSRIELSGSPFETIVKLNNVKNVKCVRQEYWTGGQIQLSGDNDIECINLNYSDESEWKKDNYCYQGFYFFEPKPIQVVGKLTNTTPILISEDNFYYNYYYSQYYGYSKTSVQAVIGFDTYNPGENYLDYFKAFNFKDEDSYKDNILYLSKDSSKTINLNVLSFTHDATDSEQYVSVTAKDKTPTYQWYKLDEVDFNFDDSYLTTPSYPMDEKGTYSTEEKAWMPEEVSGVYWVGRALLLEDDYDVLTAYIPEGSVMKTALQTLNSPKTTVNKSNDVMVRAAKTFTCTARVNDNGTWSALTDQNYDTALTIGTFADGVWSPVYDSDRDEYVLDLRADEEAGTYQYEITALEDIVLMYEDEYTEPGEYYLHYASTINNPIVYAATGYKYNAMTGNTTATNKATEAGKYACKVTIDDATIKSSVVTISSNKPVTPVTPTKKTNPTYEVPVNVEAYIGQALKDIELPEGFSFQDDLNMVLNEEGEIELLLTYTPKDTSKYNVIKDIPVKIKVEKPVGYANSDLPEGVELVVKVVAKTVAESVNSSFDFNTLDKDKKIKDDEEVGLVFNVKLVQIINGVEKEIQPSDLEGVTSIKVKMLIPEEVDVDKITRILHIHNDNDITEYKFDKSKMDENRYYEIEIDKLSEFAYVMEKTDSDVVPNDGACKVHIVFIVLSVLMLLALIYSLLKKKKSVALISGVVGAVASVITSFFKGCSVCNTWMIISLVISAVLIVFGLIKKKDK